MTTTHTSGAADRAIEDCPELNMGNYDEVDVERLSDWAIRANDEIDRLHALAAGQATAVQQGAAYAALPDECEMLKHALWLASSFTVHRYLMSNAEGRWSGAEKATCHDALCSLYVAVFRGVEVDQVRVDLEADWTAVHDATQELTDHMDAVIGFPLKGVPDYEALAPKFFANFHRLATHTLRASHGQAPAQPTAAGCLQHLTTLQEQAGMYADDFTPQAADSVQEDAARLDFLIEQRAYVVSDPDACPGYWLHFIHKETGKCWVQCEEYPTPRAAIDAARKQGEKQ